MSTLNDLRSHRADAAQRLQAALSAASCLTPEQAAEIVGCHREVCAAYAAELALIASGKLPSSDPQ